MTRQRAAIALTAASIALAGSGIVLGGGTYGGVDGADRSTSAGDVLQLVSLVATAFVGLVIALRRPENPIGWVFVALGVVTATYAAAAGYAIRATVLAPGALPGGDWAAWLRHWADRPASALTLLAFLLFPSGSLASPRWRSALLLPPLVVLGFAVRALVPGPMGFLGLENPVGMAGVPRSLDDGFTGGIPLIAGSIIAAAQIRTRYRAAGAAERQQIKWLTLPLVALLIAMTATVATFAAGVPSDVGINGTLISSLYTIAQLALPVCMAIAILRHRLYDIDVIINRAVVYGVTTAGIALTFFAGIVVLQAVVRPVTSGSELAVAASTLVSFALFQPLRRRVQDAVDRGFYRSRYDAAQTLDAFSIRLRDEVDLDAVRSLLVSAVRDTVQPAHTALWLRERAR